MQGEAPNGNGNGNERLTRFRLGEFIVDANARTLHHAEEVVVLAPRTMDVLVYLAKHPGKTVTNQELLDAYWRGAISSTNAVHKCAVELRKALGDDREEPRYIVTMPRRGYRLIADVEPINGNGANNHDVASASPEGPPAVDDTGRADDVATPAPKSIRLFALASAIVLMLGAATWYAHTPAADDSPAIAGAVGSTTATSGAATEAPGAAETKAAPPKQRIAILDVTGTSAKDAALARTVRTALLASLGQLDRLSLLDARAGTVGPESADEARVIAAEMKATYLIAGNVTSQAGGARVRLSLIRGDDGARMHGYDRTLQAPYAMAAAEVGATMLAVTNVLTHPDGIQAMAEIGTKNPEAFVAMQEALSARMLRDQAGIRRALNTYRHVIAIDPTFLRAYELFADDAPALMKYTPDKQVHGALLAEVQALRRAVLEQHPTTETLRVFDTAEAMLRGDGYADRERQVRAQFAGLKPGDACICYSLYAWILIAGRLPEEAERFRMRILQQQPGNTFFSLTARSSIIRLRDGPFLAKNAIKEALAVFPNDVALLSGIVPVLAQTGDFEEAEQYLRHLESVDRDGNWAYNARLLLQALRGDLKLGSPELRRALEHPRNTMLGTGIVLFTLGDVPGGVDAWGSLTPQEFDTLATFAAFIETTFPKQVLQDPRYQALMERLGIGASWTAQLRRNVASIAHVTGIPPGPYAEPTPGTPVATSVRTSGEPSAN